MSELNFHPVTLEDYDVVWKYMSKHGEGSCQHSFVTMFSLYEKYGDAICEQDGFLYVLREHLCHDDVRVYLAPMGDGDRKEAFEMILEDAHSYHAVVEFQTAENPIGNTAFDKCLLYRVRLCVHTVKHSMVAVFCALFNILKNSFGNESCFGFFI